MGKKKGKGRRGSEAPDWESVPLGEEFFTDNQFQDLISLQVLTDYTITKTPQGITTINTTTPKDQEEEEEEDHELHIPTQEPPTKAQKRKLAQPPKETKKKKKKDKKAVAAGTSEWKVTEEPEEEEEEEDETPEPDSTSDFNKTEWQELGVPQPLLKALEENNFNEPTPIQRLTLPASIFGRKDIVGAAETGSGKTLAFGIPIINGILEGREREENNDEDDEEDKHNDLKALILTPTRELAVQIKNHLDKVGKYTNIRVVVIVGGLAPQKQERLLASKPEIVIATPGRLWELVQGNDYLANLNKVRFLAIDETDRMVEHGHFQELTGILGVLNQESSSRTTARQNFIFSATLSFTHEPPKRIFQKGKGGKKPEKKLTADQKLKNIMELVGISNENVKIVDITSGKGTCESLVEMSISCSLEQKDYYLYYFFLCHPGRTIVFCNSINCVRRLVNLFYLLKCEPLALHSEMVQKTRLRNLERFTENDKGILIATDVAARGLDITNIEHVIHYQVPKTAESYIHRSGRTARAFKGGLALVLIEPAETSSFWNISKSLGRDEPLPPFAIDGQVFREIKARVDLAIKVEKFEHQIRKKSADSNWIEKAKKEMDLVTSEDSDRDIDGRVETKRNLKKNKAELEVHKAQLAQLIAANPFIQLKKNITETFKKLNSVKTKKSAKEEAAP